MSSPLTIGPGIGNDSIQVMLTPNFSNGAIVRASEPAWLGRRIMSAVLSRPVRSSALVADDGEPGHVVGLVLDVFGEDVQVVSRGGGPAGDGGGEIFALGELGGGGGGNHLDLGRLRQVLAQPVAALRQGLRLGIDPPDLAPVGPPQQAVMNPQPHFGADLDVGELDKHVERVGDPAVGRVFQRHQAELDVAAIDVFKYGRDRADRHVNRRPRQIWRPRPDGCSCTWGPGRRRGACAAASASRSSARGR